MFEDKIKTIKNKPDYNKTKLYMLEKNSDECGLFYFNESICFLSRSYANNITGETTSLLDFKPNMLITSVEDNPSFCTGKYDVLILKEKENEDVIDSFIGFCRTFAADPVLTFYDFVQSIIVLFQPAISNMRLNCIGLYGELCFLKTCFLKGVDLSQYWHKNGVNSKYDFSLDTFNIEIKTSIKNNTIFKIKHEQIFNSEHNYVCLVSINQAGNSGESLKELVDFFKSEPIFAKNLLFQIQLAKELRKEIDIDSYEEKYICEDIRCFDTSKLETLKEIPYFISNINYDYDFDLTESYTIDDIIKLVE